MGYLESVYNNTRYIVFIQTKYHQDILPVNDVSWDSLKALMETIWSPRGWIFRSIRIYSEDITTIKIYEMNFMNYKDNVLKLSDNWRKIFEKLSFITWFLNWILYMFVYKREVNKFWNYITNNKPRYLIDKTELVLKLLLWRSRKYKKNKEWKEIIKHIDCHKWNLIINEEIFKVDDKKQTKADYFLELFCLLVEKEETSFIELYDFIEFYEDKYYDDWYDSDYLNLEAGHIRKSYITTINNNVLKKYDKEILEIKENQIRIIQDS